MSPPARRVVTLTELLGLVAALGVSSGMMVLKSRDARAATRATALTRDARAIEAAAAAYRADQGQWPPEAGPGQVPAGLGKLLPAGLAGSFDRTDYVLDYEKITVDGQALIGVSVETADPRLLARFAASLAGRASFMIVDGRLTYFIAGPGTTF